MRCVVLNCNKSNEGKASDCSFFRFPPEDTLRKKWISFCGRRNFNPKTSYICMHHFKAEDFANSLQYEMGFVTRRLLKERVVPTINMTNIEKSELNEQRARRCERRANKKIVDFLIKNSCSGVMPAQETGINIEIENIDIKMENDELESYQAEMQNEEVLSWDASTLHNLNIKVETLQKEIHVLREEKEINNTALKNMRDKMNKMCKIHNYEKAQMERCLGKAMFDLGRVEDLKNIKQINEEE